MSLSLAQAKIVNDCTDAVRIAMTNFEIPRVKIFNDYVVKFNQMNILNEGDTQAFVYKEAFSNPNAPRVPKVYECFSWNGMEYLAMERVHLPDVETWINDAASDSEERQSRFDMACERVAAALNWLFNLSPPQDVKIGMLEGAYASGHARAGSGRAWHPFFGYSEAPFRFTDALALQRYINKVSIGLCLFNLVASLTSFNTGPYLPSA
jgi:hypothetical protein